MKRALITTIFILTTLTACGTMKDAEKENYKKEFGAIDIDAAKEQVKNARELNAEELINDTKDGMTVAKTETVYGTFGLPELNSPEGYTLVRSIYTSNISTSDGASLSCDRNNTTVPVEISDEEIEDAEEDESAPTETDPSDIDDDESDNSIPISDIRSVKEVYFKAYDKEDSEKNADEGATEYKYEVSYVSDSGTNGLTDEYKEDLYDLLFDEGFDIPIGPSDDSAIKYLNDDEKVVVTVGNYGYTIEKKNEAEESD